MKDIGKARRKEVLSGSNHEAKRKVRGFGGIQSHNNTTRERREEACIVPVPQSGLLGSGRMDPFQSYPVPVDMDMLFLIDHLHTCSDGYLRPFKDTWFPISISDPAFFYEILSSIATHVFMLRGDFQTSNRCIQSVKLHSRAIVSVRTRLLDPVLGIGDGVIGTVLAFASFSLRTNDWAEYDIHMTALYRILEARGGISCLLSNPVLRHLISGVDLAGTCFLERSRPLFPLPTISTSGSPIKNMPWPVPQMPYPYQSIWKHAFGVNSPLLLVFHDITTFIMMLKSDLMRNSTSEIPPIDRSTMSSLIDRLGECSTPVADITEDNFMEECCRLAALLLLEEISSCFTVPDSGLRDIERYNITTNVQRLHTILVIDLNYKKWILFKPLLNWIISLAAVSTSNEKIKHDFLHLIAYAGRLMELKGWDEALVTAGNMLWVAELFNERYHSITKDISWEHFR